MKILKKIYLPVTQSTNLYLKQHFHEMPDAAFVSAGEQTAGRGRLNRQWISPPNTNIYASFLMKECGSGFHATTAASLSVLEMLRTADPKTNYYIKWPNDIYVKDAKIAGILSEGVWDNGSMAGIITGTGININLNPDDYKDKIGQKFTSMYALTGKQHNLEKLTDLLANCLMKWYINGLNCPDEVFESWKRENKLIGKKLEFLFADGRTVYAEFADIAKDGSAIIREDNGITSVFSCGDLRIVKDSIDFEF